MFFLDRKGLKLSILIGGLLTTLGSVIKCTAVNPNLFAVAMLGQTICGIAQAFTLSVPARLSAIWFESSRISTATSIGVFANQLGSAIGFLVPPYVVNKNGSSLDYMQTRFYYLLIPFTILSGISTVLAFCFIKDEPSKPPSLAQLKIRNNKNNEKKSFKQDFILFKQSLLNLFRNLNFFLIFISYGIITGIFYSVSTLLNQMINEYYPGQNENAGFIGLIIIGSGLIGSIIAGIVLDKTKAYK